MPESLDLGDPLPALGDPPLPLPDANVVLSFDGRALKAEWDDD